jgi:thymidylate kinase
MKLIYLIGAPGSGKTTLTQNLQQDWQLTGRQTQPFKHETYELPNGLTATNLGHNAPPFGGTDTLPYNAIDTILKELPNITTDIIYGEGDRLANERFLTEAANHAETFVFYLNTSPSVAADRRLSRSIANDLKQQNISWVTGRATKHRNLANRLNAVNLDGRLPIQQLCEIIWDTVNRTTDTGSGNTSTEGE